MKALELLYQYQQADEIAGGYMSKSLDEAIKSYSSYVAINDSEILSIDFSRNNKDI